MSISHGVGVRPELLHCNELVVVCCHATYTGDGSDTGEENWVLQEFQRSKSETGRPSEHETFMTHILAGAIAAEGKPDSLLMFSGGMTRSSAFTEAEGYEKVFQIVGRNFEVCKRHRYDLENWATDSYQNLLFSILRFRQLTDHYPKAVTVITHGFKEDRFLELHAPAIKWPANRIRVQGINPPFTYEELHSTQDSEDEKAFNLFTYDPYGVQPSLATKRRARNWNLHMVADLSLELEEEVGELLAWEGGKDGREIFPKTLPWEKD